MYPDKKPKKKGRKDKGDPSLNQGRGVCSDGVWSTPRGPPVHTTEKQAHAVTAEEPPPWPQPSGIFTDAEYFHPTKLIATIQHMVDEVVVRREMIGDRMAEYVAFATLLRQRLVTKQLSADTPPQDYFRVHRCVKLGRYDPDTLVEIDGEQFIHVTYSSGQSRSDAVTDLLASPANLTPNATTAARDQKTLQTPSTAAAFGVESPSLHAIDPTRSPVVGSLDAQVSVAQDPQAHR